MEFFGARFEIRKLFSSSYRQIWRQIIPRGVVYKNGCCGCFFNFPFFCLGMSNIVTLMKLGSALSERLANGSYQISPAKAIEFCQQNGLLRSNKKCRNCKQDMELRADHGLGSFRCRRKNFKL